MPSIETQSPRFGVIATSSTVSPAGQHLAQRRAHRSIGRIEHQDAVVILAESPSLAGRADHAVDTTPRIFERLTRVTVGQHRPVERHRHLLARGHVRGAAHDVERLTRRRRSTLQTESRSAFGVPTACSTTRDPRPAARRGPARFGGSLPRSRDRPSVSHAHPASSTEHRGDRPTRRASPGARASDLLHHPHVAVE